MRKLNLNNLIWFMILAGFSYYIYDLVATDKILIFIHPKMLKYVIFSLIVFILLAVIQLGSLFGKVSSGKLKIGYLIFIIPLFLGFAVNPQGLSSDVAAKKGVTMNQYQEIGKTANNGVQNIIEDGVIAFNEADFSIILGELFENPDKYADNEVIITGFVFRDEDLEKNQIIVARMLLNCCAADAQVVGMVCEGENVKDLADDQWIRVKGRLGTTNYHNRFFNRDETIPYIKVDYIDEIERPTNMYVYP